MVVVVKPVDENKPSQFLSAPRTADGKGTTARNSVIHVLVNKGVPLEKVILLGFDTTASNSGIRLGAAVLIERQLATLLPALRRMSPSFCRASYPLGR